jgi:DNA repair photolyase
MSASAHKGRGAVSRTPGRFEKRLIEQVPDDSAGDKAPETLLRAMQAGKIINYNNSPDVPFDRSINPYQGCEHGCVYCYARPSHSYLDLSPGLDFETRIFYKPNAVQSLLTEWEKPGYICKPITIGANTDPYQPAEKKLGITRQLLETFLQYHHPVSLISKGGLMSRDFDLLSELAKRKLVSVAISIPTMNADLKRILEPRVPAAAVRFQLMRELCKAGIPVSLLLAPVIPALNDAEIEAIVERSADCGIRQAAWVLLRLPHELKLIFTEWLETHLPERAAHVMSLMRQASGGRDYDNRYGVRQRGKGAYAAMLSKRFDAICRKRSLNLLRSERTLDCGQFVTPGNRQLALGFD